MARPQLTMNRRMDMNNPYLAQWYARAGVPLNKSPEDPNQLSSALNNYSYHLRNRKNIAEKRPNQI
jgi:hypothetical protein